MHLVGHDEGIALITVDARYVLEVDQVRLVYPEKAVVLQQFFLFFEG